mmetsp:Transcript_8168/g.21029  ORF Transcript_8168/g.21029 Transcript_8168/m.21029 type:complete len:345 (-) Transcript_8168:50-1084(-)
MHCIAHAAASQTLTVQSSPAVTNSSARCGCAASAHSSERAPPPCSCAEGARSAQCPCSSSLHCGAAPPSCHNSPARVTSSRVPRANASARTHGASPVSKQRSRPYSSVSPVASCARSTGLASCGSIGVDPAGHTRSRPPRPPTATPSAEMAIAKMGHCECRRTARETVCPVHSSSIPREVPVSSAAVDGTNAAHSTVCAPAAPNAPLRALHPPPPPPLPTSGRDQKRTCRWPKETMLESLGEKTSPSTAPAPPRVRERSVAARQFHSAIVCWGLRSAHASSDPSGVKAMAPMPSRCPPASTASVASVRVSHTCTLARAPASPLATSVRPGCSAMHKISAPACSK